jgi:hypothetical protein
MARNLSVPEVEAVIVASCPESHQNLVTEICKRKNFQKAYGRSEDMANSSNVKDWMGTWQAKVVTASITKAQSLNTRRIKIIFIEGGKFCDEEHACMPQLKKTIAKEWIESGHATELRLECLWVGYDSFFEHYGHDSFCEHYGHDLFHFFPEFSGISKFPPVMNEAKIRKLNPKEQQQLNLNNNLPFPPPEIQNPGNADPLLNEPEKIADSPNENEVFCDECSRSFASRKTLIQHLHETDHKFTVHYCTSCNDRFSIIEQHGKTFILPLSRLEQHQTNTGHTGVRKLETSVSQLKNKFPRKNESKGEEWACGEFRKTFKTEKARDFHQMAIGHCAPSFLDYKDTFDSQKSLEQHFSATGHYEISETPSFPSNPIQSNQQFLPADVKPASEASVKVVAYLFSYNSFPVITVISFPHI